MASVKPEGTIGNQSLIFSSEDEYYLKHQKIFTFVEKTSKEEIHKVIESFLSNMFERLKYEKKDISYTFKIEEIGHSGIYLITGRDIHLISWHDTGPVNPRTPSPSPIPIVIDNNRIFVSGHKVFTTSQIHAILHENLQAIGQTF